MERINSLHENYTMLLS